MSLGMPDVLRFAEVHDLLGHIFGVVGDAFEAFEGDHLMEAAANRVQVFDHMLHAGRVDLFVERVHFLVAWNQGAGSGVSVGTRKECSVFCP